MTAGEGDFFFLWGRGLSEREKGQDKVKSNQD